MASLYRKGICKQCNDSKQKYLIKKLCKYHYWLSRKKAYKAQEKPNRDVRQKTGELKTFQEIFDTREKLCAVTGAYLGSKEYYLSKGNFHFLFHHVLPKSIYPKFRLFKDNIIMVLPDVHIDIEQLATSDLLKKYSGYQKIIDLKENLKLEYGRRYQKRGF